MNATIVRHIVLVFGAFLTPFLAGFLQRCVVNPLLVLGLRLIRFCATYAWHIVLYATLMSLLMNRLPDFLADHVIYIFDRYALYDSWPMQAAASVAQRLALDVFITWVRARFAWVSEVFVSVLFAPKPFLEFLTAQFNETVHKFA
jgi:hypothetical protein